MNSINQLIRFSVLLPKEYQTDQNDGLDQYRKQIAFLNEDLKNELRLLSDKRITLLQRIKIIRKLDKENVKPIKHYMEKIDRYKKEGWVDKP